MSRPSGFSALIIILCACAWLAFGATALARGRQASAPTVKDPVCGMTLDPSKAHGKVEYRGKTYYFCSDDCKAKFQKEPAKYAGKEQAPKQ